jgi:hypothetical protein
VGFGELAGSAVTVDSWILALHVLSAFALVAGIILFWILIVVIRRADTPARTLALGPLSRLAETAIGIGAVGTIGFGVWLSFSLDHYEILDGWIVTAVVLWFILMAVGQRADAAYGPSVRKARELQAAGETGPDSELLALNRHPKGVILQALVSGLVLLILLDMIWKPGT